MANETVTIPDHLRAKAEEKSWPLDLIQQALAAGATPEMLIQRMDQGISADQARQFLAARTAGDGPAAAATAATVAEPSEELKAKAAERGWGEDLLRRALQAGGAEADVMRYLDMGISAEQAEQFLAQGAARGAGGVGQQLDLSWMDVPTEWNTRARPTKHGLTLEAINIGRYGDIPDVWEHQTEMPRGAVAIEGVEAMGYSIYQKQEVWSDACAALYEEAIQRRWRPATDVPWTEIEPLPDDVERAICQLCTSFSERAQIQADILGRWEPEISYGYHEVKLYLATVIFEDARAVEVFRKRALSNGGGLGVQAPGWSYRSAVDARNFTEMATVSMVFQDSLTLAEYEYGEMYAKNPAEKFIFGHVLQDKARHLNYGVSHLKYVLLNRPERRDEMQRYLDKAEAMSMMDERKDASQREAYAIYFAGGKDRIEEGLGTYRQMRARGVQQYLARLRWATLDRRERLNPGLRAYIEG